MKYLLVLIAFLAYTSALVHYVKLEKGANGCKVNNTELAVGESIQDPKVCGVFHCQTKEGDALILYCQISPKFADCPRHNVVITTVDFPECCWTCAILVICR